MPTSTADRVYDEAADLFGLLSAPTRLRIVCALMDGERNVSELLEQVAVSQPNMSQHLGTLYRSGVLGRRRTGAQVYYRVEHAQVRRLCQALKSRHKTSSPARAPRKVVEAP
ncbi:MAG: winged helix-turn-helix transcriptional regulator [Piscinibacter sp.]|nr:winged helix-turn-helix transcriptional regulator [Piscinibacter sp.]